MRIRRIGKQDFQFKRRRINSELKNDKNNENAGMIIIAGHICEEHTLCGLKLIRGWEGGEGGM